MASRTVQQLFEAHAEELQLQWLAGQPGSTREIKLPPEEQRTAYTAVGYLSIIHPFQVQLVGRHEMAYLDELGDASRRDALNQIFTGDKSACLIVTENCQVDDDLYQAAEQSSMPLIKTPESSQEVLEVLHETFIDWLAKRETLHGVFMDVLGMGVLITGDSGAGKSELALELISRGHRLVADDVAEFVKISHNVIDGSALVEDMTPFLEVRGLGILNVQSLFGDSAVKRAKYLRLIVRLERVEGAQLNEIDRLQHQQRTREILGVEIPEVSLPVAPGRNLAVLMECAVRNHSLKMQGYSSVEDFMARQRQAMREASLLSKRNR
ncbi:MAG: HPr(Ser) kinase/phosphatase [Pseudomonadota bacterium]